MYLSWLAMRDQYWPHHGREHLSCLLLALVSFSCGVKIFAMVKVTIYYVSMRQNIIIIGSIKKFFIFVYRIVIIRFLKTIISVYISDVISFPKSIACILCTSDIWIVVFTCLIIFFWWCSNYCRVSIPNINIIYVMCYLACFWKVFKL